MAKTLSRVQRWNAAIVRARAALDVAQGEIANLCDALSELDSIREEYADWRGNLPENLDSSPIAEKLDAVVDLEIDTEFNGGLDEIEQMLDEAEGLELPLGFGRD